MCRFGQGKKDERHCLPLLQVEFLNSVIVELQQKNENLQIRLQAMEEGVFNNGHAEEGMDIS